MALQTTNYQSIGLIVGIATIGVIVVVATVALQNRKQSNTGTVQRFQEPESGLIVETPLNWTVGAGSGNTLQLRATRLSQIQAQRSTCSSFSKARSEKIQQLLTAQDNEVAMATWQEQFPGMVIADIRMSRANIPVLIGIDTCDPILTRRTLTFRGQLYSNDVELQFSQGFAGDTDQSETDLKNEAVSIFQGNSLGELQSSFLIFTNVMASSQ